MASLVIQHVGEPPVLSAAAPARRRGPRSCDHCKKYKKRCGGALQGTIRCESCAEDDLPCTWSSAVQAERHSAKYVRSLEERVQQTEQVLRELLAKKSSHQDLSHNPSEDLLGERTSAKERRLKIAACVTRVDRSILAKLHKPAASSSMSSDDNSLESSDDERHAGLLFRAAQRGEEKSNFHYFVGRSSTLHLARTAMDHKMHSAPTGAQLCSTTRCSHVPKPWEEALFEGRDSAIYEPYIFPDEDLMATLIDLYFARWNAFYPLLHRPTFETSVSAGLHHSNDGFAVVLLLVCALGARFCSDPRVLLDPASRDSAGWAWFKQARRQLFSKVVLSRPCLYDLQMYCLAPFFIQSSACWAMVGIGIRRAQEVGAHRRKAYRRNPTMEDELWKRAFWILVYLDRTIAYGLGRPCAIQDEDYDLDLPASCDDEYWIAKDDRPAFQQPADSPSYVAFFICTIDLCRILAIALRTICSIHKSKTMFRLLGPKWGHHVVSELESALDRWSTLVPSHLTWNPDRAEELHFAQSAQLHVMYHHIQIIVHQPFIASLRKPIPTPQQLANPSFVACAHAAHQISRILDAMALRNVPALPHTAMTVFASSLILLLNLLGTKHADPSADVEQGLRDVGACINALRLIEPRWAYARALQEILSDLLLIATSPINNDVQRRTGPKESAYSGPMTGDGPSARRDYARSADDAESEFLGLAVQESICEGGAGTAELEEQKPAAPDPCLTFDPAGRWPSPGPYPPGDPQAIPHGGADPGTLFNDPYVGWSGLLSSFEMEGWRSYFNLVDVFDADAETQASDLGP